MYMYILRHVNDIHVHVHVPVHCICCYMYMYKMYIVYTQAWKGHNYYYTDKTFRYFSVCSYVNKHVTLFSLVDKVYNCLDESRFYVCFY